MIASIFNRKAPILLVIVLLVLSASRVSAQTTEFTYQGKLSESGNPATGSYDFEFLLYDALAGGTAQGLPVQRLNVAVASGIFTVQLDFGNQFNGANRFLDISVKAAGGGLFTPLSPRQQVTSNPYAIKSLSSSTADGLSVACANCVTSSQIQSVPGSKVTGSISGSQITGEIPVASIPAGSGNYVQNTNTLQAASNFNISGNGTAGGTLSANAVNATTQYNIGGGRVLSASFFSSNVFVGLGAGAANIGNSNSFFGASAGAASTSGNFNSFFGASAGASNTTGFSNAFFGSNAGAANTTGRTNAFFGTTAGQLNTTGVDNSYFGIQAGFSNQTGNNNSFFGRSAGLANTASDNSFFGMFAGDSNTIGTRNSFFGRSAGDANVSGGDNAFFGYQAGLNNTASSNSFFGSKAGDSNTTGSLNAFFGESAGDANTTGSNNAFFGRGTGVSNTIGDDNAFFGTGAGSTNTGGDSNTFIGRSAGNTNTAGIQNTFVGRSAGNTNTTGSNNTYIGSFANGAAGISNATAIGANAFAFSSNEIKLGTSTETVVVPGSVLIFGRLTAQDFAPSGSLSVCRTVVNELANCSSSLRYKTNIAPFNSGLSLVNRLRPITFDWKTGGMHDLGLGAEDVAAIEPLLVTYNKDGQVEGVKYDRIGVVLLNAVREQQAQIISLQTQLDELRQATLSHRKSKSRGK
ncbi:MAG: tail fiber domain-containing protein [Acidobacteriota bacterium]